MTDEAIIAYLKDGSVAGKTNAQMSRELLSRGVTASQIKRLLATYKNEASAANLGVDAKQTKGLLSASGDVSSEGKASSDSLSKGRGKSFEDKTVPVALDRKSQAGGIFGHDVFTSSRLTFEPNENAATPSDYVLGPGDEINIDIWGNSEASLRRTISPEGTIMISGVGRMNLSGLTIEQATAKIKRAMAQRYSSIEGNAAQISVTLSRLRTIAVNILGEVSVPGTYRLSSFSTVFNALYRAGGVSPHGSLRDVRLVRNGKQIASIDVYKFLFSGDKTMDAVLKEGDVIIVPVYKTLVKAAGGVKRPMFYEMADNEHLANLIDYAGGFVSGAHKDDIGIARKEDDVKKMFTIPVKDAASFTLADGDSVFVSVNRVDVYENKVEVRGAVYRPGVFQLGGTIATVGQLIAHAGGLLENAFGERAQIVRELEDRSFEMLAIPVKGIVDGVVPDIALRKNDILIISDARKIDEKGDFSITGYVAKPGNYQYAEHTTVEDLILLAGGLTDGASVSKVEVARRINIPGSTVASDTLATIFSFAIKDGLAVDGASAFELQPYDVVAVRRAPTYIEQRVVTVSGEVNFPGQYVLESNHECISDIIARAGGPTSNGNVSGGMLRRKINQYERNVRTTIGQIVKSKQSRRDSLDKNRLTISEVFNVGVEIDKALANPGSKYDMVLRDGDELIIPELTSTVRVQGEVLFPNTVQFIQGKPVRYYVKQSGGFGNLARRSKVYVIHMNGTVSVGSYAKVDAGSEIIVPSHPESKKLSTGEWLSIGTTAASLSTMIATIVNLVKK